MVELVCNLQESLKEKKFFLLNKFMLLNKGMDKKLMVVNEGYVYMVLKFKSRLFVQKFFFLFQFIQRCRFIFLFFGFCQRKNFF